MGTFVYRSDELGETIAVDYSMVATMPGPAECVFSGVAVRTVG